MTGPDYYDLKVLARQVRAENGLTSPRVTTTDLQKIYVKYDIELDFWPYKLKNLHGAFVSDSYGTSVMLAQSLPQDPMAFTMAHELKHFLTDQDLQVSFCDLSNLNREIEVGAEVFAAEMLFPDQCFVEYMSRRGIKRRQCTPETLVRLKQETRTTLSYAGLSIRAERLGYSLPGTVTKIKTWRTLERSFNKKSNAIRPIS
jgi:Zn-dependent peptidase ImmA (M78 family)